MRAARTSSSAPRREVGGFRHTNGGPGADAGGRPRRGRRASRRRAGRPLGEPARPARRATGPRPGGGTGMNAGGNAGHGARSRTPPPLAGSPPPGASPDRHSGPARPPSGSRNTRTVRSVCCSGGRRRNGTPRTPQGYATRVPDRTCRRKPLAARTARDPHPGPPPRIGRNAGPWQPLRCVATRRHPRLTDRHNASGGTFHVQEPDGRGRGRRPRCRRRFRPG
jgi:hypothetical protein